MVELGPYIEFRCKPYVSVAYVKCCVLGWLLFIVALLLLVWLVRNIKKSQGVRAGNV